MATRKWSRRYQCQCPRPQSGDGIHSERQIPKMAERQAARTIESTVLGGAIGTGVVVGSVILSCTELDTELDASSDPARIRNHPYLRNWPLQVNYTRVGVLAQDAIQYTVTIVHYSLLRLCSGAHRGGPQGPLRHGGVRTIPRSCNGSKSARPAASGPKLWSRWWATNGASCSPPSRCSSAGPLGCTISCARCWCLQLPWIRWRPNALTRLHPVLRPLLLPPQHRCQPRACRATTRREALDAQRTAMPPQGRNFRATWCDGGRTIRWRAPPSAAQHARAMLAATHGCGAATRRLARRGTRNAG